MKGVGLGRCGEGGRSRREEREEFGMRFRCERSAEGTESMWEREV